MVFQAENLWTRVQTPQKRWLHLPFFSQTPFCKNARKPPFLAGAEGQSCFASFLLGDQKRCFWYPPAHLSCLATKSDAFGTRLRICFAKNSSPNCFFTLAAPLGFKSFCFDTKKESNYLWQPLSFLAPTVGLEPTSVCNINSTASHKATGFIVLRHNPPRSLLPPPAAVENIPV